MAIQPITATDVPSEGFLDVKRESGVVVVETVDVRYRLTPDLALDFAAALIAAAQAEDPDDDDPCDWDDDESDRW